MTGNLSPSARRVQAHLDSFGIALEVVEFPSSTRTAQDAADSVGCEVAQIAKSLVFRRKDTGGPLLVIASGANRVDLAKVSALLGAPIAKADADFVREATGYAIGGIPPCGHATAIETILDDNLMGLEVIWAAAGTPNAVFRLTPSELERITGGRAADIKAS
ncbi:MAG: YbaK/EbsC family protein [Desulfocurvibacter africanus]